METDPIRAIARLDEPRRRALYELVTARREPIGRDEAAAALGIGRELAAFHLDRLAAAGLLDVEYRRLSGRTGPGAGRPAKLYRRSNLEARVSLPARDYERLASLLAEAIVGEGGEAAHAAADEAAHRRGADEGRAARAKAAPSSRAAAPSRATRQPAAAQLQAGLVELLGEVGYEPATAPDGAIHLQNCPYHALSATHRDLTCGMNLAWAEGVLEGLGGDVEPDAGPRTTGPRSVGLRAEFAPEPGACCVVFRPEEPLASTT